MNKTSHQILCWSSMVHHLELTVIPRSCQVIKDGNEQNEEEEEADQQVRQVGRARKPVAGRRRTPTIEGGYSSDNGSFGHQEDKFDFVYSSGQLEAVKDKLCDTRTVASNNPDNSRKNNQTDCFASKIDSRSILINKERLKKFWESRMEMEFKSRQGLRDLNCNSGREANDSGKKRGESCAGTKLADENNNDGKGIIDEQQQQIVNLSDEEWRSLSPAEVLPSSGRQTIREEINEVPYKQSAPVLDRSHNHEELQQPMSIDPTLCHPPASAANIRRKAAAQNVLPEHEESLQVESSVKSEEQTINEEFSSASSSSFGPMSISMTQEPDGADEAENESENEDEDEDEPNDSTLSGSVSTVITKGEQQRASQLETEFRDDDADADDDDETGSNIGVVFESLHFDNDIKSSKQEMVDEHFLLMGPKVSASASALSPAAAAPDKSQKSCHEDSSASPGGRVSANEVKSVCNLIKDAITDAGLQVESLIQHHGSSLAARRHEKPEDDKQPPMIGGDMERATFVEASPLSDETEVDMLAAERPKANLSSIFEANVRREIQRFETHSNSRSCNQVGARLSTASTPTGTSGANNKSDKSGLTEWRIAEEIRLFNERELELKRRLVVVENGTQNRKPTISKSDCGESQVVRFGKTLRIPKPSVNSNGIESQHQDYQVESRVAGIKLSSSLASPVQQQQQQPAISMHKFIASGGKRFVLTAPSQQAHHMSKSMSNLSTAGSPSSSSAPSLTGTPSQTAKPADYKAVDSLRCKETPNVEPGMARKVIESFSRLRGQQFVSETKSASSSSAPQPQSLFAASGGRRLSATLKSHQHQHQHQHPHTYPQQQQRRYHQQPQQCNAAAAPPGSSTNNSTNSAEWKIQEELREMRAREAELRNEQKQRHLIRMQQQADDRRQTGEGGNHDEVPQQANDETRNGSSGVNMDEQVHISSPLPDRNIVSHSGGGESLYPIKQAIDSFRRLNVDSPAQLQQHSPIEQQQINGIESRRYNKIDVANKADNYEPKVGAQRRKIALIERWECKNNNLC